MSHGCNIATIAGITNSPLGHITYETSLVCSPNFIVAVVFPRRKAQAASVILSSSNGSTFQLRIAFSIAATVLGIAFDRFLCPLGVTTMSSSMRTPRDSSGK